MATLQVITASNTASVDPDAVTQLRERLSAYDLPGLNVTIEDHSLETETGSKEAEPCLWIRGYGSFDVSKPLTENGEVVDRKRGYTEEFLGQIAPYLEEKLVVETVGHEKCRFPLLSSQWAVWPDGTVTNNSMDHSPTKPESAKSKPATQ